MMKPKKIFLVLLARLIATVMTLTMVLGIAAIAPSDMKVTLILLMVVQVTTTMLKAFNFFLIVAIEFGIKDQTWWFSVSDIDECIISSPSPCNITCHNLPGTYSCSCPEGYEGDGRTDGSGCSPIPDSNNHPLIKIALGRYTYTHMLLIILLSAD